MGKSQAAKKYSVILCDPPWEFRVWNKDTGHGRSAEAHYKTMTIDDICRLDVPSLATDNCTLFLWVTWPVLLDDAPKLLKAWGFTYRTCAFNWTKVKKTGQLHFGMGYWTRANSEPCLLATRGKPKRKDKGVPQSIWELYEEESMLESFRGHSVKPDEQYTRIERLVDGPYLELFSRRERKGWTCVGNEIDGLDMKEAIRRLATCSEKTQKDRHR